MATRTEKKCLFCGKLFVSYSSQFCSSACRGNKAYHDAGKAKNCIDCGVDLVKGQHSRCRGCQDKRNDELKKVYAKQRINHSKSNKKYPIRDIEKHRENCRRNTENRRSRKLNLIADLTQEQWHKILLDFDNKCAYCGKAEDRLHQDHFIPVVRGGGYTKTNIVPSCKSCNSSKRGKNPVDFLVTKEHGLSILAKILDYFR